MAGIKAILIGTSLLVIAIYAMIGYFANRKQNWAFITGAVIYGLDALMLLAAIILSKDNFFVIPLIIHAWALWRIINGLKANLALPRATYDAASQQPQTPAEF